MHAEKRCEREREMRMNNMGTEQHAKMLACQQNRDISERIALGLAKPTLSKESMLYSRLFNQDSLSGSFGDEESYNLYDKPLFHGSSAAAAIYKACGNIAEEDEEHSQVVLRRALAARWIMIGLDWGRRYGKVLCSSRRIRRTCSASKEQSRLRSPLSQPPASGATATASRERNAHVGRTLVQRHQAKPYPLSLSQGALRVP